MQLDNKKIQIKDPNINLKQIPMRRIFKNRPIKIFLDSARVNSFATAFITDIFRTEYQY